MSDRVVTVAPSYKDEIITVEGAWGMEDVTRGRFATLDGILNGEFRV
jgi:glycogen synthase